MKKYNFVSLMLLAYGFVHAQNFSPDVYDTNQGKLGDTRTVDGLTIDEVPAFNNTPGKENFHPKDRGNVYVIHFGNMKVYVAGDTEDIPEMASLKGIDIAFLPVNQPYTMLPEQLVRAVQLFKPTIVYPYHFGETDMTKVQELFIPITNTKLIIKSMK